MLVAVMRTRVLVMTVDDDADTAQCPASGIDKNWALYIYWFSFYIHLC